MNLIVRILRRVFWVLCKACPVKKNKVVFQSYYGRGYGDNPKYVAEALRKTGELIDFVWVVNSSENPDLPDGFRTVKFRSFRYIYEMSTARVWVDNCRKERCLKKKDQYYMQTWHGGMGMKKAENMAPEKLSEGYLRAAKRDASQCDVMLAFCDTQTEDFRKFYWYPEGEILKEGLPRNDRLLTSSANEVARIRQVFGIKEDCKLLLYAPTFRQNHDLSVYNIDYSRCVAALEKRFGGTWKVLLRLHPNIFKLSDQLFFDPDIVVNVSYHPDMQELYMIADMLITDYSSVIFDFLLTERPSMLYAADIAQYRQERDYYFDFSEIPFALCETNDQLEQAITEFDEQDFLERIRTFKEFHGFYNSGCAAQCAANWILDKIKK